MQVKAGSIIALFLGLLAVALTVCLVIIVTEEVSDEVARASGSHAQLIPWSELSLDYYASVLLAASLATGLSGSIFFKEKKSPFLMATSFLLSAVAFVYLNGRPIRTRIWPAVDVPVSLALIISSIYFVSAIVLTYENLVNKEANSTEP